MDKGESSTVDHGWSEPPADVNPSAARRPLVAVEALEDEEPPPISASSFPEPDAFPAPGERTSPVLVKTAASNDTDHEFELLDDDALVDESPTDTAKRRTPARSLELRDDSVAKVPVAAKVPSTPPPSSNGPRTVPPPVGYDQIRRTASRMAFAGDEGAMSSRPVLTPTPVPSSPMTSSSPVTSSLSTAALDPSRSAFRNEFAAPPPDNRWMTTLAIVLVIIGLSAGGAAAVLALRTPPVQAASPPTAQTVPPLVAVGTATAAAEEAPTAVAQAEQETPPQATGETPHDVAPSKAAPPVVAAKAPAPPNASSPIPAHAARPPSPSPSPAKSAAAPASSVPPGLQFLKRNL